MLLQNWLDIHGPPSGRHDAKRVWVTIAPGDKHPEFLDSLFGIAPEVGRCPTCDQEIS